MLELLNTAITGSNIIPTILLGVVIVYWLSVIIGAVDIDFLDLDFDTDADADVVTGPLHGILSFINSRGLPLMFVLSIIILVFWVLSMLMHLLPFQTGGIISGLLMIPNLFISMIITKLVTSPLKGLFKDAYKIDQKDESLEGNLCTLLCDLPIGGLGQAEVQRDSSSIIINVKAEDEDIKKSERALVLSKDSDKHFYYIKKFEEV